MTTDNPLYKKILLSIPVYVNDIYLHSEDRELIAKAIYRSLEDDECDHKWVKAEQLKLVNAELCGKCNTYRCKHLK